MTTTTAGRPVRLRLACDSCSAAKVKCDKKHPCCDRCKSNALPCTYSASRRHGKQSWQKRQACEREKAAAAASVTQQLHLTAPLAHESDWLRDAPEASTFPLDGQAWDSSAYYLNAWSGGEQALERIQAIDRSNDTPDPMQFWPQVDFTADLNMGGSGNSADLDDASGYPLTLGMGLSQPEYLGSGTSREASSAPSTMPQTSRQSPLAESSFSSVVVESNCPKSQLGEQEQASSATTKTHDCEARAIAVLRSLSHCSSSQFRGQGNELPDLEFGTGPVSTPSFDKVLVTNKVALSGWSELMNCPCAQCPHLTFLYASILSKVLFWYGIAAAETHPTLATEGRTNRGIPQIGSPSHAQSTLPTSQFGVRPTQIQIGCLDLDQEDQANLRRVILLRELRKLEKAIEEIIRVKQATDNDVDEAIAYQDTKWLALGICKIKDELQHLIQKVKAVK